MAKVRICECGHRNRPEIILCRCGEDISRLPLAEEDENLGRVEETGAAPAVSETGETSSRPKAEVILTLLTEDRREIKARDGDIIGRAEVGSDYLQNFPTVSRKHIQVFGQNGACRLKNLSETNETWLNGRPVPRNEEREINLGDELKLSTKCRLTVM